MSSDISDDLDEEREARLKKALEEAEWNRKRRRELHPDETLEHEVFLLVDYWLISVKSPPGLYALMGNETEFKEAIVKLVKEWQGVAR